MLTSQWKNGRGNWPEMQSCRPAPGTEMELGGHGAVFGAWLCDFLQQCLRVLSCFFQTGCVNSSRYVLRGLLQPKVCSIRCLIQGGGGRKTVTGLPEVGSPVRWEILLSMVYNTTLSPHLHTWQMAQLQHSTASWGTSEIWTYVHNTSL